MDLRSEVKSVVVGRYRCDQCGRAFVTRRGFANHHTLHSPRAPERAPTSLELRTASGQLPKASDRQLWVAAWLFSAGLAIGWVVTYGLGLSVIGAVLGIGIAAFALGFMVSLDREQYFGFLGRTMVAVIPTIFVMFIVSRPR